MLTYPKSTMRVLRKPMHLFGPRDWCREYLTSPNSPPQSDIGRRAD